MRVADRMRREVISIDREASLRRARRVMDNYRIRHLPVVDGRRLVGILTDRDIRFAAPSSEASLTARERDEFMDYLRVGLVMTRRIITATVNMSVGDAARLFLRYRIGCLPVVEDRVLVGIVTRSDLMEVLAEILYQDGDVDRVEVDVPEGVDRLESLLRIAGIHQARMVSMMSLPGSEAIAARALFRIEGDVQGLCAALSAAGFRAVLRPAERETDSLIVEHLGRN